jgi:hypothetical protein
MESLETAIRNLMIKIQLEASDTELAIVTMNTYKDNNLSELLIRKSYLEELSSLCSMTISKEIEMTNKLKHVMK